MLKSVNVLREFGAEGVGQLRWNLKILAFPNFYIYIIECFEIFEHIWFCFEQLLDYRVHVLGPIRKLKNILDSQFQGGIWIYAEKNPGNVQMWGE